MLIGRHIGLADEFELTPNIAHKHGYNIMQIFVSSPQQYNFKKRTEHETKEFKKNLDEYKLKLVIHSAYVINLSKEKPFIKSLIRDLEFCEEMNGIGCVIHMGHYDDEISEEQALKNYIKNLKYIIHLTKSLKSLIILETGSSQGKEVGSKLEKMAEIYNTLTDKEKERVGFCIDTCHIWISGYDISTKKKVDEYFKLFDKHIGIENIVVFHFNDSSNPFNSHLDRHMNIGYGTIGEEGLLAVFIWAKNHNVPIIMETPSGRVSNYKTKAEITFEDDLKKVKSWLLL